MNNPFRSHMLPRFTICAGILGFLLRMWLFSAVDEKGLLPKGHFADIALYILSAIVLAILFLSTRKLTPRRVSRQFILLSNTYTYLLGGLGMALNAAFTLSSSAAKLSWVATSASLIGTAVMVVVAILYFLGKRIPYGLHVFITVVIALNTIAQCQVWGSEPQLQNYFFPLLASVFLILTAYCITNVAVKRTMYRHLAFYSQAALYFSILSLISPQWMFYAGMLFWAAAQIYPCTRFKKKV